MVAKASFIADPDFIDRFILARHDALDHHLTIRTRFPAQVDRQVAAHRAVGADGGSGAKLPWASFEAEVGCGERTHRTDIGRIAREIRVETRLGIGKYSQTTTAVGKSDHRVIGDEALGSAHSDRTGCSVPGPGRSAHPRAVCLARCIFSS